MKMFSDCSGECCLCACAGGCLAGHGDDDFTPASKEQLIKRLDEGRYKDYTELMKATLKNTYNYDYDKLYSTSTTHPASKEHIINRIDKERYERYKKYEPFHCGWYV